MQAANDQCQTQVSWYIQPSSSSALLKQASSLGCSTIRFMSRNIKLFLLKVHCLLRYRSCDLKTTNESLPPALALRKSMTSGVSRPLGRTCFLFKEHCFLQYHSGDLKNSRFTSGLGFTQVNDVGSLETAGQTADAAHTGQPISQRGFVIIPGSSLFILVFGLFFLRGLFFIRLEIAPTSCLVDLQRVSITKFTVYNMNFDLEKKVSGVQRFTQAVPHVLQCSRTCCLVSFVYRMLRTSIRKCLTCSSAQRMNMHGSIMHTGHICAAKSLVRHWPSCTGDEIASK